MELFNKKNFFIGLGFAVGLECVSLIATLIPALQWLIFFVIVGGIFLLSLRNPLYGIFAALIELAIGGKGYLLSLVTPHATVSLRMGIFAALLLAWGTVLLKNKPRLSWSWSIKTVTGIIFLLSIAWGIVNGIINHPNTVFTDANAWLYFVLAGFFITTIRQENVTAILSVIAGAATWLSLKTIVLFVLFSRGAMILHGFTYNWLRDTGVGEVTEIGQTMYRIFFQSHLYVAIVFTWCILFLLSSKKSVRQQWLVYGIAGLTSLALLMSQSRSLWIGTACTLVGVGIFTTIKKITDLKTTGKTMGILVVLLLIQLIFIGVVTGNYTGGIIGNRFSNGVNEPAASSRANQLAPLKAGIMGQPIFGSGFGKSLTYESNDPRIREQNENGLYTTYAFEWGYLDIMLKIGFVGLMAYLVFLGSVSWKIKNEPWALFFLAGLGVLLATNILTPYLNHPLGIGYILIIIALAIQAKFTANNP